MRTRAPAVVVGASPMAGLRGIVRTALWSGGVLVVLGMAGWGVQVADNVSWGARDVGMSVAVVALLSQIALGGLAMVLSLVGWRRAQRLGLSTKSFRRDTLWGAVLGVAGLLGGLLVGLLEAV